jgi:DNA-binding response OmpR family regulator
LKQSATRQDVPIFCHHLARFRANARTMLLEGVWDYHFDPGTNVIDVHVSRLRKTLDEGGARPLLHTVRGAGYRLGER